MFLNVWFYMDNYIHQRKHFFPLFLKRFYLFIFREQGRERGREGEKHQYVRETSTGCLLHMPQLGTGPKPRHVPWLGTELVTLRFAGQGHSANWATPVRAEHVFLITFFLLKKFIKHYYMANTLQSETSNQKMNFKIFFLWNKFINTICFPKVFLSLHLIRLF